MGPNRRCRALVGGLAGLAFACAEPAAAPGPRAPTPPAAGVERYLPLPVGFVYQYDVETDTGETGRMMMQVSRPRPGLVELEVAGKVQRLEVSADAVRHATGGYLLKAPLALGSEWKGQFGTVRVSSLTRSIQTPAGGFEACLETIEEAPAPAKRATSVYCLDVGLVRLHIEGALDAEAASVATTLRSYGPRPTEFD
ncbi:MAG TPA: hypothetical protein VFU02_03755 [Polyangiaceae bacterium]|nr:hypothetical protein [Polyangiaceae bacterium]